MSAIIVIPALNPSGKLLKLVEELTAAYKLQVVVVNDGSNRDSSRLFESVKQLGCDVLTHPRNLGKGEALKTGIRFALDTYPEACGIATADADGQHSPHDIYRIALALAEGAEGIVLGVRRLNAGHIPLRSRWGNNITAFVFWMKTGIKLTDTQTGLRGIPRRYVSEILQVRGSRFEYEMNMLLYASRRDIPIITRPIDTIYPENNHASHFRVIRDSARIYFDLLKFGCSSLVCTALDFSLFFLLSSCVFSQSHTGIILSTIPARIVSGVCNFLMNKRIVFKEADKGAPVKYFFLFIIQMVLSAWFTSTLTQRLLIAPIAKLITDSVLFILSFFIQRTLIFKRKENENAEAGK